MVAVIGPAGVANHTHHIVEAFHSTKVKVAQPSIERVSRHEGLYCALSSSSGTKPPNSVMQLEPHQLSERSSAEARANTAFVFFENCRLKCIILQRYEIIEN